MKFYQRVGLLIFILNTGFLVVYIVHGGFLPTIVIGLVCGAFLFLREP